MKRKFTKILGVGLVVVLLFSLATIPVLATIANLSLAVGSTTISASTSYTTTFTAGVAVAAAGTVTVTFPTGADITGITAALDADVTIAATAGIGGAGSAGLAVQATSATAGQVLTITVPAGCPIGAGSLVQVIVTGVVNPGTVGTYTVTVATSGETTAVSATFTTTPPSILPLPGVVERYNSAGVLMEQTNIIATAITNASAGDVIKVGAGTYDEIVTINKSITLQGNAATTILKDTNANLTGGNVIISLVGTATTGAVLDGFTIMGNLTPGLAVVSITGEKATVQNCVFTKAGTATTAVAQTMISYAPGAAITLGSTITNCTFDTTLGTVVDTCINVPAANSEGLTVSNCTFSIDGAFGAADTAVAIADGTTALPTKVTGCTIIGASGDGVAVTAGVASVTSNILSTLNSALKVTTGTVTLSSNTIDTCGLAVSTTVTAGQAAIVVTSTAGLTITNNTITNCPNDIIEITDNSELINMMFNNMSNNTLGIDNNDADTAQTLNASHNWWGAATGPATGMNSTAGAVNNTAGYLGGTAIGTFALATATLTAATTQKVDVSIANATTGAASNAAIIGVANYAANPGAATPYTAISGGFFDVYVGTPTANADVATIKLYGAVTTDTVAYVYSALNGTWAKCTTQGVNTVGGYVFVKTGLTITPAISDLAGTAFALVTVPTVATLATPTSLAPAVGATDVPLSPTFAWSAVTDAAGYYFQMADNANFVAPLVKLDGDLGRLIVTAYHYAPELEYSTAYYWRVKAVKGTVGAGDLVESTWASGVIITMDVPEEPLPPIVIEQQPATPAPIIKPIVEVITPAATPITPAWIYAIIGVGALLVIAVIVLIVRTRRVA